MFYYFRHFDNVVVFFKTLRYSTNSEYLSRRLYVLDIQMVTMSSQSQAITDWYQRVQSQAERGHINLKIIIFIKTILLLSCQRSINLLW